MTDSNWSNPAFVAEQKRICDAATKGWQSMRDGNQFVNTLAALVNSETKR